MAPNSPSTVRVAVTQAEPEWLDLDATVEKTCRLVTEAAQNGAKLIAFPEVWVTGYPAWIWSRVVDFSLSTRYIKNSLRVDSPQMDKIRSCAAENSIAVCLGFSENDHDSIYISQCLITASGQMVMHRRKMKPTHMERTVFGEASGSSLQNVVDLPGIGRVGALSCWEHAQPLLKYHAYLQREAIHVAAWPPVYHAQGKTDPGLWSMSSEGCRNLSQTYAIESQSFVLHTTAILSKNGIDLMGTADGITMNVPGGGSSAIFGPDGRQLSEDIPETEERVIYADLDLDECLKAKSFLDTCGHYSRPDLLWLGVDRREKLHVQETEKETEILN